MHKSRETRSGSGARSGGSSSSFNRERGGDRSSSSAYHSDRQDRDGRTGKRDELNSMRIQRPNFANMDMLPFQKEFYTEPSSVANKSQSVFNEFYRENNVVVNHAGQTRNVRPVMEFDELSACVSRSLIVKMHECNYDRPTPIQSFCWPTLLSGLNMVGVAQTGSGKTLGFVLPMLVHIYNNERYVRSFGRDCAPGPVALILAPTRELAQQIQEVSENFAHILGLKNVVVYGGASKGPQLAQIRRGAEIYIATPGRLLDYLKENIISLQKCTYLVLDEADRMLDMGFEPQIRKIIEQIRPDRQTAMFSATWPKEVRKLAEDFISNYVHISIGTTVLTANPNIKQNVEVVDDVDKERRLREILLEVMNARDSKAIVFAETKKRVDSIAMFIKKLGFYCLTIHGDKKQMEREWVLNEFKQKPKAILCATDVAARGLNIEDIKYVINVDYPQQTEDYVHRIGRTARNSNAGTSYTFLTRENARHVNALIDVLRETDQFISDELWNLARSGGGGGSYGRGGRGGMGGGRGGRTGPGNRNSALTRMGGAIHASNDYQEGYGSNRGGLRQDYNIKPPAQNNSRDYTNGYANSNSPAAKPLMAGQDYTNGNNRRAPQQQQQPYAAAPNKRDYSDVSGEEQNGYSYSSQEQQTKRRRWDDLSSAPPPMPPPPVKNPYHTPLVQQQSSASRFNAPQSSQPTKYNQSYQGGTQLNGSTGYNGYENDLLASFRLAPPPPPPGPPPASQAQTQSNQIGAARNHPAVYAAYAASYY